MFHDKSDQSIEGCEEEIQIRSMSNEARGSRTISTLTKCGLTIQETHEATGGGASTRMPVKVCKSLEPLN